VLVTEGGADPIASPRQAVLERVNLTVGQEVKKGDPLFVMRVDDVREWRTETDARQQALLSLRETSAKLEESHSSELRIKASEIQQAEREASFREKHLETMRDLWARVQKLAATGFISEIELAAHRLSLAQSEKDLEIARRGLAQKRIELQGLELARGRQRIQEKSAIDDLTIRIAALDQPLSASPNGLLEIRAPYDAVCISVTRQNAGSVVAPGEELCQLSPLAGQLETRLDLPESGLSRLQVRQPVRLFFDAFPYQRYGVVTGAIDWISPAAVTNANGVQFVARATMDRTDIQSGQTNYPLRAGMRGQARVTVGRRALIEYAFEPLRKIRENLDP
jgi:multidrug resistance efflux pump